MPNFINGTAGADVLHGTAADDDYLQGFQGNDTIDGGVGGNDIAAYNLPEAMTGTLRVVDGNAGKLLVQRADGATVETVFEISRSGESFVVRGVNSASSFGTDLVSNIDDLHFLFLNAPNPPGGRFVNLRLSPFVSTDGNAFVGGGEFADVISIRRLYPNVGAGVQANAEGARGDDLLVGHAGANNLGGGAGSDTLLGGRGDDYLQGAAGDDEIDGGRGTNDIAAFNLPETVVGTLRLTEGAGANAGKLLVQLVNGANVQTVFVVALEGDQATVTGVGLAASQGVDVVANVDQLHFLPVGPFDSSRFVSIALQPFVPPIVNGEAFVGGSALAETIDLASLYGAAGAAADLRANGGRGDDLIVGTEGTNGHLDGQAGDDTVRAGGGNDYLLGSAGNDVLDGGTGANDVAAFRLPQGLPGTLQAVDGVGADAGKIFVQRTVGGVAETVFEVTLTDGVATVRGLNSAAGYGVDTVSNVDQLHFTFDNEPFDQTRSVALNVAPFVGAVNGTNAFVGGGIGDDSLNLSDLYPGVGAGVSLSANGNQGDDLIVGHVGNNDLQGGLGDDTLLGGAGNDGLTGGVGDDSLDGGAGTTDSAQWRLAPGTIGTFRVVEGVGVDAGKLIVERVDGATVEALFQVTLTGGSNAIVTGVNSAADVGTDTVSNVDQLQFFVPSNPFNPAQFTSILLSPIVNAPNNGTGFVTGSALSDQLVLGTFYPANLRIDANGNRGDDLIIGHVGVNQINGGVGDDFLFGGGGSDSVFGGAGNDAMEGGDGEDLAVGDFGDDTLTGNGGDDVLRGFEGVDVYAGGEGFDRISFYALFATQGVVADLALGTVSNDGYGNAESFTSIEGLGGGTRFADLFRGDGGANVLIAETGDTVEGFGGDDDFQVTAAAALADGGEGVDFAKFFATRLVDANGDGVAEEEVSHLGVVVDLSAQAILDDGFGDSGVIRNIEGLGGTESADALTGDIVANELLGFGGHDTLAGLGGLDSLDGGEGDDRLDGGDADDKLLGGAGSDVLEGGVGDDTVDGGDGRDAASYAGAAAAVSVSLALQGTAQDVGDEGSDTLLNVEDLIGSAFDDALSGDGEANLLWGGGGNDGLQGDGGADTLLGGAGADTLTGGSGRDAAAYTDAAAGVTVSLALAGAQPTIGAGSDTLIGMEDLIGSQFGDTLTGDGGANALIGAAGADTLVGGLGPDTLNGGLDVDLVSYASLAVRVNANLSSGIATLPGGESDTLTGVENLIGGTANDTLIGDGGANALQGGNGDDVIEGGDGADTLNGGAGNDTASFAGATAGVNVSVAGSGQATGAGTDSLTGFEHLSGSSFADVLRGDGGANLLSGGAADDSLNGGLGADTLVGGAGSDTAVYLGSGLSGSVTVDLAVVGVAQDTGAGGLDVLQGIENVTGGNAADVLSGDTGANVLRAFGGEDSLDGRAGNDDLSGGAGADTLAGGIGGDKLAGDDGDDRLIGGAGVDQLAGGTGADAFVLLDVTDSGAAAVARDRIRDFSRAQGDVIDLSAIDAVSGGTDDSFVLTTAFSGAGQLVLSVSRAGTLLEGHVNGDGVADFAILLERFDDPLTVDDFVL